MDRARQPVDGDQGRAPSTTAATSQTPGAGVTVNVTCPCSLWGTSTSRPAPTPTRATRRPVEVGVKFKSDSFGAVTGVRFYKAAANTGTHIGSLWTRRRARAWPRRPSPARRRSGWQTVTFATPVQVTPGTTYVASYFAPNGHYAATADYFYRNPRPAQRRRAWPTAPPLHAVRNTGTDDQRRLRLRRRRAPSRPTPSAPPTTGSTSSSRRPRRPGQVTNVTRRRRRQDVRQRDVDGARDRRRRDVLQDHAVHRRDGADADDDHRLAAGDARDDHRADHGHDLHVHRAGDQPDRLGPGVRAVQRRDAADRGGARRRRPASPRSRPRSQARSTWTAPTADGDSPITGYTVTPYIGATAQTPVSGRRLGDQRDGHRPDQRHGLHVQGHGHQRRRHEPRVGRLERRRRRRRRSSTSPRRRPSTRATPTSVELGVKFKADYNGTITGIRFYKAATNTGTHTGSLWTSTGTRLAQATFTNESASGWQTVDVRHARWRSRRARPTSPRTSRPAATTRARSGGLATAVDNPPLHALADSTSANGVYAYSTTSTFPSSTLQRRQLLGRRACTPSRRPGRSPA